MSNVSSKFRRVSKVAGKLGVTAEQIDQLMDRITSCELYKKQRSSLGNPEILLGFLLNRISKIEGEHRFDIIADIVKGEFDESVLEYLNSKSYSTYEILLESSRTV